MESPERQRARRWWTEAEDQILRYEAELQLREGSLKDWNRIAKVLPGRTNKDCRKRWSKVSNHVNKGMWTADEDRRLEAAVAVHGSKWTHVATMVATRHADQCAKRWRHSLNPNLDRGEWTPEDDRALLSAVAVSGRNWKAIGERRFPARSTTDIKNRYVILDRRRRHTVTGARISTRARNSLPNSVLQCNTSYHHSNSNTPALATTESWSAPAGSLSPSPPASDGFDLDAYSDTFAVEPHSSGGHASFLTNLTGEPAPLGLWLPGASNIWPPTANHTTAQTPPPHDDLQAPVPYPMSTSSYTLGPSHPPMTAAPTSAYDPTAPADPLMLGAAEILAGWPEALALDGGAAEAALSMAAVCEGGYGTLQAPAAPPVQMQLWAPLGLRETSRPKRTPGRSY